MLDNKGFICVIKRTSNYLRFSKGKKGESF